MSQPDPPVPPPAAVMPPGPAAGPRRRRWPVLLAAMIALAVGVAGGLGVATGWGVTGQPDDAGPGLAGQDGAAISEAERYARGACQARVDWDLTEPAITVAEGSAQGTQGWTAVANYGAAAGLTDPEYAEFQRLGQNIHGHLSRWNEEGLAQAATELADLCAQHEF